MNNNNQKTVKMDTMRMKDIVAQPVDIIYLLCEAKGYDIKIILHQLTNLSDEERNSLNLIFSQDIY